MEALPHTPPAHLLNEFAMGGKIPVQHLVLDNRLGGNRHVTYDVETVENMIAMNRQGLTTFEPYPRNRDILYSILEKNVSCVGKDIAVIGTQEPWIEAVFLQRGCKSVVTVEYNVLDIKPEVSEKFNWHSIHYAEFCASPKLYDLICSFSSVEHDGLGRYGDPMCASADFTAMAEIRKKLRANGRVLWGAPVGADVLVWNAHRIYGPIRLPRLLHGFRAESWTTRFTYFDSDCHSNLHQPWIVLFKTDPDEDPEKESALVHASIVSCPKC